MNVYLGELYKEVEYIQSSWTQYINTGYTGSSNTKIDTKLSITTRVWNYDFFYGSSWDWTWWQPCTFIQNNYPENNKIRVVNYANSGSNKRYVDSINNLEYGKIYNIIHTNTSFIIDWVSQGTMSATTYTLTYPFWIFWVNNRGSFAQRCAMKLYSFKIYESWTLVRDFVPCYRVSDNVIWLFDKVGNKFYTNAGTGTFTKWNDVKVFQPELKNAYIGEYIEETYTEAKFWNNTSWVTKIQSIYKAWYKVTKIVYDTAISAWSDTSYWAVNIEAIATNTSTRFWAYILFEWSISWNYAYKLFSPWETEQYDSPTSPIFWYTTAHVEITPDYVSLSNWTWTINKTFNYSASSKAQIETYFSQSDIGVRLKAVYPYLWPTTITVTYEKI